MPYAEAELGKLLAEVRRPFANRDKEWDRRRDVRFRRAQPWLPKGIEIINGVDDAKVYFQDSLPGFVVERIKSRMGANDINLAIKMRGDAGPNLIRKGENLEDWLRGALDELDPHGFANERCRDHLAGDGVAFLELEFMPNFSPPARNDEPDGDYDDLVQDQRKNWGLPLALNAPDPRSLYWIEHKGRIKLVCKVINVPLVDIQNNWTAEGFQLRMVDDKGKIDKRMLTVGELPPSPTAAEYGRMVRVVRISDDEYIYDCCFPNSAPAGANPDFGDNNQGQPVALVLLSKYRNPLGKPPYFKAGARPTPDADPAYAYQPLALEMLDTAEYVNQVRTTRMIRAIMSALKPVHAKPRLPADGNDNAGPKKIGKMWQPGMLEWDGDFLDIPTPDVVDFDKFEQALTQSYNSYNLSIMGALQAGTVGKSAPAWTVMQFNEEQVGMLQPALDSLADCYREMLLAVVKLGREKYGIDGAIYVRGRGRMKKAPESGNVDMLLGLKADDFNIPFRLQVTIDAMTQSQRAANTEYNRELHTEGRISDATYDESIGITDPVQEQARIDREQLRAPLRKAGIALGFQKAANVMYELHGNVILPILQSVGLPPPNQIEANGGMQLPPGQAQPPLGAAPTPLLDRLHYPGHGIGQTVPQPAQPQNIGGPASGAQGVA